jgi:hypothetical protein
MTGLPLLIQIVVMASVMMLAGRLMVGLLLDALRSVRRSPPIGGVGSPVDPPGPSTPGRSTAGVLGAVSR